MFKIINNLVDITVMREYHNKYGNEQPLNNQNNKLITKIINQSGKCTPPSVGSLVSSACLLWLFFNNLICLAGLGVSFP